MKTPKDFVEEIFNAATSKGVFDVAFFKRRMSAVAPGCSCALSSDEKTFNITYQGAILQLTVPSGCKVVT